MYSEYIVLPKICGAIYSFYGSRMHEVKEVTHGKRWSLILFIDKKKIKSNISLI
jgi:hypothetical protein